MRPFLSSIRRALSPSSQFLANFSSVTMARAVVRSLPLVSKSQPSIALGQLPRPTRLSSAPPHIRLSLHSLHSSSALGSVIHASCGNRHIFPKALGGFFANQRGYRKLQRRAAAAVKKHVPKEKQLELDVKICIEEEMPDDPEVLSIAEILRLNVPMAMKIAFDGLKDSDYKTRDTAIDDVGKFEKVELSVLFCNDDFIRKLNKDWRDEDHATDVLSMSQHIPELDLPILMLGDIVISVETAARQAEERGHTLLDEIRILMVHGLLHLLGFDHEISDEAEAEMEKEEDLRSCSGIFDSGQICANSQAHCSVRRGAVPNREQQGVSQRPEEELIFDLNHTQTSREPETQPDFSATRQAELRAVAAEGFSPSRSERRLEELRQCAESSRSSRFQAATRSRDEVENG